MKLFEASCDCGFTQRETVRAWASAALLAHECPPQPVDATPTKRCECCGHLFWLLVDDALCIRCDSLLYPDGTVPFEQQKEVA